MLQTTVWDLQGVPTVPESPAATGQKPNHVAQKLLEALGVNHDSGGAVVLVSGELNGQNGGGVVGTFNADDGNIYAWVDLIIRGDTPRISIEPGSVEHQELSKLRAGDRVVLACTAKYDSKLKVYKGHRNGRLVAEVS